MDRIAYLFGSSPSCHRFLLVLSFLCLLCFRVQAADFVLIVDASTSMKAQDVPGKPGLRRLDVVAEALQSSLQGLPLGSRVYLAAFNKVITPQAELVLQSEADRARLLKAVSTLDSLVAYEPNSGSTHLWSALDHALQKGTEYVKNDVEHTLVVRVYTDGEDNERNNPRFSGKSKQQIIQDLRDKYPAVADYLTLVLLGNMEFHLRGINVTKASDFHFVLPTILVDPPAPDAGAPVSFTLPVSQVFDSYDWSIDSRATSRDRIFTYAFPKPGTYLVKLTVSAHNGQRESVATSVQVGASLNPSVTFVPPMPEPAESVAFFGTASKEALSPTWLVDGAEAGSGLDFKKSFDQEGKHEITFRVQDAAGRKAVATASVSVAEKPVIVGFDSPTEVVAGNEVEFKNTSSGRAATWRWDFGDQKSSGDQNPRHSFANISDQPVTYKVVLHATSPLGRNFSSEPRALLVHPKPKPPKAGFHVGQPRPKASQLINFLDDSTGIITSRRWQFADEGTSSLANPEYAFRAPGEKTVQLTVSGPGGSDTATHKIPIRSQQTSVTVSLLAPDSSGALELPQKLDFGGNVNPDHLRSGYFIGDGKDTLQLNFSDEPEDASAVVLDIVATNDVFRLLARRDGKAVPLQLPARLRGNTLVQVAINTNAVDGMHQGSLTLTPVGADLILNDTNLPVALGLEANVGHIEQGGPLLVLILLVLAAVIGAVYYFLKQRHKLTRSSKVTLFLAEKRNADANPATTPGGVSGPRTFELPYNEMIILGQSPESARIFDLQAPDWRIRREETRIVMVDRRDFKSATVLKSGDVKEVKTSSGSLRRLSVSIQIGLPQKPQNAGSLRSKQRKAI